VKIFPLLLAQIFCSPVFTALCPAQSLSQIELRPVFTNLKIDRPVCLQTFVKNLDVLNQLSW